VSLGNASGLPALRSNNTWRDLVHISLLSIVD